MLIFQQPFFVYSHNNNKFHIYEIKPDFSGFFFKEEIFLAFKQVHASYAHIKSYVYVRNSNKFGTCLFTNLAQKILNIHEW